MERDAAIKSLLAKACPWCARGWPIDDGNDGVLRGGRYHGCESPYSPGKFGGGYVECKAADERLALASSQYITGERK